MVMLVSPTYPIRFNQLFHDIEQCTVGQINDISQDLVSSINIKQVYRKSVKRGFEFTLMVVGETGLGKSTLINSMFLTDIYSEAHPGPSLRLKKTVQVETSKVLLREGAGVNLTLTIVDTPGFGDAVDNSSCWEPVLHYVESQYEAFLEAETQVHFYWLSLHQP